MKITFVSSQSKRERENKTHMAIRQRAVTALPNLIRSLRKEPLLKPPHTVSAALPSLRRAFSLYDQINLIDNVPDDQLRFQGYTDTGFTINGVQYEGSLLCVGNLVLSWKPNKFSDITPHSLSLFQVVRPIPEILIIGCGRNIQHVDPEVRRFIRSTGIKLEVVDSRNASSTYNILNEEGRVVAAAVLPYGVSS
ncbi:PREDICTED: NADH dehydrogenase [ubiquinone] 1 alpha subcomplex assembly factor 3-like [Lupinus angustifolius]|uniref:NADH dehydrogenase [ubiquinone] 1 alpha subcomplex assembly factor 3-like n=1 Tax=Lupinus angustifolius TaxID=3871 RepID=UPI00092E3B2A|nr:PREDICTED: NADH dehydrogenase [ubiquinone] 1 alpha subcomplex assembly factor 3-like [Lupinus angustifolius]